MTEKLVTTVALTTEGSTSIEVLSELKKAMEGNLLGVITLRLELLETLAGYEDEKTHYIDVISELDKSIKLLQRNKRKGTIRAVRSDDSTGDAERIGDSNHSI